MAKRREKGESKMDEFKKWLMDSLPDARFIEIPNCDNELEHLSDDQLKQMCRRAFELVSLPSMTLEGVTQSLSIVKAIERELHRRGKEDLLQELQELLRETEEGEKQGSR